MPRHEEPVYRRGKYTLDWDRRADGTLRSPYLAIFWYDSAARRVRSQSTGTTTEDRAVLAVDKRYLAERGESPAYCHACGQPLADAHAYLLADAIADYRLEWGDARVSGDTIESRLKHVLDFMDAEEARDPGSRFGSGSTCAIACTAAFANAFRAWLAARPVEWRNGEGQVTVSRPRSPAAVEAVVAQLIAVLNYAADADPPRSDKRPAYAPVAASQVQRRRRTRVGIEELAKMLRYAAVPGVRREGLHSFLVASICTLGRPGAIVDISVAPVRRQWWPGSESIDLNPDGRVQNKKRRALLPVMPLLNDWLLDELARYEALEEDKRIGRGWLVNYYGRGVKSIDRAWDTMLGELDMPRSREWRPYLLRHSVATLVRNRGSSRWDLEGFMGHRAQSQTETYAIGEFPKAQAALQTLIDDLSRLAPGALHRRSTGQVVPFPGAKEKKMPG